MKKLQERKQKGTSRRNKSFVIGKTSIAGITLIALVVTIVVLIILATVSINAVFSENGIIKQAQRASAMQTNAIAKEAEEMNMMFNQISGDSNNNNNNDNNNGDDEIVYPEEGDACEIVNVGTYSSLKDAIEDLADGDTLILLKNQILDEDLTIPTGVTLEINKYYLKCNAVMTIDGTVKLGSEIISEDGIARSVSDVERGRIVLGEGGDIVVNEGGNLTDTTLVENAALSVGDYINYPYSYENIVTSSPVDETASGTVKLNGWRIVSNYTDDNGNKIVKIISAGIPEEITITSDEYNAENLDGPYTYSTSMGDMSGHFLRTLAAYGSKYLLKDYATAYTILGLDDSYKIYNNTGCGNDLVLNGGYYWVNAYQEGKGIIYITPSSYQNYTLDGGTSGIRPVMTLKNDLHVYKLYDEANSKYYWEFVD